MGRYAKDQEPIPGYRLKKFLGKGGFGEVWKAQAPGGIFAALKFISLTGAPGKKEFAALSLMKTIRHTNLVPMFASWFLDDRGNIVADGQVDIRESGLSGTMMLPSGSSPGKAPEVDYRAAKNASELVIAMGLGDKSLADRLEECKKQGVFGIPVEELLDYLEGAARAIDFLNRPTHDLGNGPVAIQHCDIKPLNLLVVGDACQVCDFGLARVLDQQDSRVTALGGSPAYSSPECLMGKPPCETTDQYSLAISYVELRTGFLPFDESNSTLAGVINAHLTGKLELSRLTDPEAEIVRKATSIDPTQRYTSCLAMIKSLRKVLDPTATKSSRPESRVAPVKKEGFLPGYKTIRRHSTEYVSDCFECQDKQGKSIAMLVRDVSVPGTEFDFQAYKLLAAAEYPGLQKLHSASLLNDRDDLIGDLQREPARHHAPSKLVLVYDFVPRSLLTRLKEYRRQSGRGIPAEELVRHLRRLAKALDFLNAPTHAWSDKKYRIIHGNLSPESIWLIDGEVSLSNFASSRAIVDEDQSLLVSPLTAFEHPYTSPDLLRNKLTPRSDQSSLAMLYAHLRTGESPFDASVSISNLRVRKEENSLDLTNLAPDERKVVLQALSPNPKDRFESCTQFVEKIDEAIQTRKSHESWVAEPVADDQDPARATGIDISGTVILTPTPAGSGSISGSWTAAKGSDPTKSSDLEKTDSAAPLKTSDVVLAPADSDPAATIPTWPKSAVATPTPPGAGGAPPEHSPKATPPSDTPLPPRDPAPSWSVPHPSASPSESVHSAIPGPTSSSSPDTIMVPPKESRTSPNGSKELEAPSVPIEASVSATPTESVRETQARIADSRTSPASAAIVKKSRPKAFVAAGVLAIGALIAAGGTVYSAHLKFEAEVRDRIAAGDYEKAAELIGHDPRWGAMISDKDALIAELLPKWREFVIDEFNNKKNREPIDEAIEELHHCLPHAPPAIELRKELKKLLGGESQQPPVSTPPEPTATSSATPVPTPSATPVSTPPVTPMIPVTPITPESEKADQLIADANAIRRRADIKEMPKAVALCDDALRILSKDKHPRLVRDALLVRAAAQAQLGESPFSASEKSELDHLSGSPTANPPESRQTLRLALQLIDTARQGSIPFDAAKPDEIGGIVAAIERASDYRTSLSQSPDDAYKPIAAEQALTDSAISKLLEPKHFDATRSFALSPPRTNEEGLALIDRISILQPKDFSTLAARGLLLFRQGKLRESVSAYGTALRNEPGHPQASQVRAVSNILTTIAELPDDGITLAAMTAALDKLGADCEVAARHQPEVYHFGVDELLKRGEQASDPTPLVRFATFGRKHRTDAPFPASVDEHVGKKLVDIARKLARDSETTTGDVAAVLALTCEEAKLDEPRVQAYLTETLLAPQNRSVSERTLKELGTGLEGILTKATVGPIADAAAEDGYYAFVRALALHALAKDDVRRTSACDALALALTLPKASVPLTSGRSGQAADLMFDEIDKHRFKNPAKTAQWLTNPYVEKAPLENIVEWNLALLPYKSMPADRRMRLLENFASTLPFLKPGKSQRALDAAAALLDNNDEKTLSDDGRWALQWGTARLQADDDAGRQEAVRRYAGLFDNVIKPQRLPAVLARELYKQAATPAFALAQTHFAAPATELKPPLAVIYATRARLLKDSDEAEEDVRGQERVALRLAGWEKAIDLDPSRVQFFIGRGNTLRDVFPRSVDSLSRALRDGEAAAKLAPADIDALYLLSGANIDLARNTNINDSDKIRRYQEASLEAIAAMTEACTKDAKLQPRLGEVYCQASSAHTELANFVAHDTPEGMANVTRLLEQARDLGRKSVDRGSAELTHAHRALGNALEDLAWIVGQKDKYDLAIAEFQKDVDINTPFGEPAPGLCNLGRCRFKKLEVSGLSWNDAEVELAKIEDLLKQSAAASKNSTEATFWLASIYAYRALNSEFDKSTIDYFEKSEDYFEEMIRTAKARGSDYDQTATEKKRDEYRDAFSQRFQGKQFVDAVLGMDETARMEFRERLGTLRKSLPETVSLVIGSILDLEKKYAEARAEFDQSIPTEPTKKHVPLLIRRGEVAIKFASTADSTDPVADCVAAAADAEKASELADDQSLHRYFALRTAGKARFNAYFYGITVRKKPQAEFEECDKALAHFSAAHQLTLADPKLDATDQDRYSWRKDYVQGLTQKWMLNNKPPELRAEARAQLEAIERVPLSEAERNGLQPIINRLNAN